MIVLVYYTLKTHYDGSDISFKFGDLRLRSLRARSATLRVQVPNSRILSQRITYITTLLNPST